MQLSKIKIAGFKSFVDPTTISLPGKLVAIVGPNGCGKSNIIDAVTWVMGESSPKYLRGEALTDVIFNGSGSRKPIGQASVELVFDNSDGSIGGEYAKFSEISVKRLINRESDSSYFLNGVRCRKRDVVDIFLGTGLGPRSYSIIGQNMITRVIEAKPDELRTYLEEAAGISKYKDRRRETELRIQHTKENLARVNDVRTELEKQLAHLKHQANVAEKFKGLKQQERTLRAELYAIEWRELDGKMVDYTLQVQREETALQARNSELSGTDREIEQIRYEKQAANDGFQEVQRRYYAAGNEITRIEQDILHHQERQTQWENDLKHAAAQWQTVKDEITETEDNLREVTHEVQTLEPQLTKAQAEAEYLEEELASAEEVLQEGQHRWDEFHHHSAKTNQSAQVEKNNIQHLEQRIQSQRVREEQLQQEKNHINFASLTEEIENLSEKSFELTQQLEEEEREINNVRNEMGLLHTAQAAATADLDNIRSELQRLHGQEASLEALQQTALGQRDNPATPWIEQHQLTANPRLAQYLEVETGWEFAVEKVLGLNLKAICVDALDVFSDDLAELKAGSLCLFTPTQAAHSVEDKKATLLLEKIKSPWPVDAFLAGIYTADSLQAALTLSGTLAAHESVITKDGVWVGASWLKILRDEDAAAGVFQRGQALKALASQIDALETQKNTLESQIAARRVSIQQQEERRDQLQHEYTQHQAYAAQLDAQHKMKAERLRELKAQAERLATELADSNAALKQTEATLVQSRERWETAMQQLEQQSNTRETLLKEREQARQQLQHIRQNTDQKKTYTHELEIRFETAKSQKVSLHQTQQRLQAQLAGLTERKKVLENELNGMAPLESLQKSLTRALDKHVGIEAELNSARVAVESLEQEYRRLEEKRLMLERTVNKIRTTLESLRVELQGWKVKADSLVEQINETEYKLEEVLMALPADITPQAWQIKLEQTTQRIHRLGPINLVAIEEYATCSERKEYLDKQMEDLQSGLSTLEDAIAKIDRETRARFKETFDKVNARFQELFPTIFGGGKAYLELNSDDLLEAGVTMMACPPGKRNSSIYLLSGGEKSLTAIALIFSIFHLNPAPFCLLDEVDAALDDANVARFTRLVKTMSDKTQFFFISHNKITIEMGEHLIGVTMNEPGVSRLVSVDIEKAMSLAGL